MTLVRAPADYLTADTGRSWVELMAPAVELAKQIATTDFVPRAMRNNPAAIAAAILYGDEVGLGPMQSLAKIAVIDGRPFVAAEAQRALVYAAGHELWLEEATNTRATWAGRRAGSDQVTRITWSMEDARRAHIDQKPNWRGYPRAMLSARASAELVRAAFADVVGGLAAIEEYDDSDAGTALGVAGPAAAGPATGTQTRTRARRGRSGPAPVPGAPAPAPAHAGRPPISTPDEWRRVGVPPLPGEAGLERPPPAPGDGGDAPAPISGPQRNRMHGLFRRRGISDRAERLRLSREWIGRDIASSAELTGAEADRVIDVLESLPDPEPPEPSAPAPPADQPADALDPDPTDTAPL